MPISMPPENFHMYVIEQRFTKNGKILGQRRIKSVKMVPLKGDEKLELPAALADIMRKEGHNLEIQFAEEMPEMPADAESWWRVDQSDWVSVGVPREDGLVGSSAAMIMALSAIIEHMVEAGVDSIELPSLPRK